MTRLLKARPGLVMGVLDATLVWLALALATLMRRSIELGTDGPLYAWDLPLLVYILSTVIFTITYAAMGIYNIEKQHRTIDYLAAVAGATLVGWFAFTSSLYLSFRDVSRLQAIYFFLTQTAAMFAFHVPTYLLARRATDADDTARILLIGTPEAIGPLYAHLRTGDHKLNLDVLGGLLVDLNEPVENEMPVLGSLDDAHRVIDEHHINEVIIAIKNKEVVNLPEFIRSLQAAPVQVRIVPNRMDFVFWQMKIEYLGGVPLFTLKSRALTPLQRVLKRAFDIVGASALILLTLPLMLATALAIYINDRGTVLFLQNRIGEGGRIFKMYKFRSMYIDSEKHWREVALQNNDRPVFKHPLDPRVTRVGRFIRKTSIDELPQLFNVLQGHMSLVGPRPELPEFLELYEAWQMERFNVPQGLTGWWQVNGRSNMPMYQNTEQDLYYIRNYSLWLDVVILLRTISVVLSGRGAY